jgi:hypothetical protein
MPRCTALKLALESTQPFARCDLKVIKQINALIAEIVSSKQRDVIELIASQ